MPKPRNGACARLASGCKLNLYLKITGVRRDGYHLLESLFLPLSEPSDTLLVSPGEQRGLTLRCDDASIPLEDNTVRRAYHAFASHTGFAPGLTVRLIKKVPHGAGLGGGSADAAVLLRYLYDLATEAGNVTRREDLFAMAASIGADVPFFLVNKPALVGGIGEIVRETVNPLPGWHLVLVCPPVQVNTAWAFGAWDAKKHIKNTDLPLTTQRDADTKRLVQGLCVGNDLCPVVFDRHPQLRSIVTRLRELGANAASMSGSGSSLFGLFTEGEAAEQAFRALGHEGFTVFHHVL